MCLLFLQADYIRQDVEGSDSETRRRAASDLIRGLCVLFDEQVTSICSEAQMQLLTAYAADPARGWKNMEAAIALVMSLTIRAETRAYGVTSTNPRVNIVDFGTRYVLPELSHPDVNDRPVLKVCVLAFVPLNACKGMCMLGVCTRPHASSSCPRSGISLTRPC